MLISYLNIECSWNELNFIRLSSVVRVLLQKLHHFIEVFLLYLRLVVLDFIRFNKTFKLNTAVHFVLVFEAPLANDIKRL